MQIYGRMHLTTDMLH